MKLIYDINDLYNFTDLMYYFLDISDYESQQDMETLLKMYYEKTKKDYAIYKTLPLSEVVSSFKNIVLFDITDFDIMKHFLLDYYDIDKNEVLDNSKIFNKLVKFAQCYYGILESSNGKAYYVFRFE